MPTKEENKMGKWGATSYIIGNIVGSGIFITPTSILKNASSVGMSLVIWFLSAVIATLGAYCYVELGTSIRKSGADFAYLCYVKWKAIAFAFMSTGCILTYPCTLAVQAQTFSEYIIKGLDLTISNEWCLFALEKLIGFSLIWLLLYINFFSLHTVVARFQIVASLAKLAATGIIIGTGAYVLLIKQDLHNLRHPFANSHFDPGRIANAFFAGLFSYDGWDILNFGAEEVENPRVTMSFAILVGMSSIASIFLAMNLAYFTVLSVPEIEGSNAVALTFAQRTHGPFQHAMPFFVSILIIGSLNGTLFSASRYLYAAARERHFPAFIGCVNEKHDSPRSALFVHVLLAMAFSFLGNLDDLIAYLGFSQWILRMFTMAALLYIRLWHKPVHPDAIKTPLILPIFFLVICCALVFTTILQDFKTASIGLLFLAIGFLVYLLFLWDKSLQRFSWYRHWANLINVSLCIGTQIIFNGAIELINEVDDESQSYTKTESTSESENGNNTTQIGHNQVHPLKTQWDKNSQIKILVNENEPAFDLSSFHKMISNGSAISAASKQKNS